MDKIITDHQIQTLHRLNKLELRKKINSVNIINSNLKEKLKKAEQENVELRLEVDADIRNSQIARDTIYEMDATITTLKEKGIEVAENLIYASERIENPLTNKMNQMELVDAFKTLANNYLEEVKG
jgi:hypothetical protein